MTDVDTFWCEPTGMARIALRRFTMGDYPDGRFADDPDRSERRMCAAAEPYNGYAPGCRASAVVFDVAPERRNAEGFLEVWDHGEFAGNPAWPTACEACGEPFTDDDSRAVNQESWYASPGRGLWVLADLPAGAMYDAFWYHDRRGSTPWVGDDGISLMVVCPPGGVLYAHWCVDGPANNCTRKGEPHHCWCRSGDPRAGDVNVTKDGCDTCTAGAGSIATADWHGFLRNGRLVVA